MGVEAFGQQWQPRVNQDIGAEVKRLNENEYEVVLSITISVQQEDKVLYLVEVHQAGCLWWPALRPRSWPRC